MTRSLMEFKTLFSKETGEYSDEMSSLVYEWGKAIQEEFLKSSHGAKMPKIAQRYLYLVSMFADLAYNYHHKTPGNWTESEIDDACCYLIPRKLIAPKEAFKQLPRILKMIFLWGEEIGIFNNTKPWCEVLDECKKDIVENAGDPSIWGLSKSILIGF